ncbi:tail length tape measure protein [Pseudomonas nitroreducens]|uniref:Tail length tape measure protein n=1 Tax=Pseudomonas nitroreducens TaxID=46680 RepID=A0A5R9A9A5_PSENT|nr:phage tail length tape measure family protein [Pseudomonas nitroreducens]TLP74744.1 tail length tape measure protein [Pseudomonas nitroreducens]
MTDIHSLGLRVESGSVRDAAADLEKLTQAGTKAEQAAAQVGNAWTQAASKMSQAGAPGERISKSFTQGTDAIRAQQQELAKLLGKIDPVVAAYGRLDDMEKQLGRHKNILAPGEFAEYSQKIKGMRDALGTADDQMTRTGNTAKQTAAALRLLPAQFTDIAVGLQAGQSPFTVLLQQGGQIKDQFGGIGPALAATGRYALSLVNPFTAAAVAAGGLSFALYDVWSEASKFNQSLFSGDGSLRVSAAELQKIAEGAGLLSGSFSDATDAVIALGTAGKVSETQLKNLAEASASIAQYSGKGAADIAKDLSSLGDNATDAAAKISDKFGLVTAAQYDVIRALDDQGEHQKALDFLSETVNQNAQERLARYRASLSEVEKDWDRIGNAISNAYNKIKGELFPNLDKQIEQLERIQQTRQEGGFLGGLSNAFGFGDNSNEAIAAQLQLLRQVRGARDENAAATGEENEANERYIELTKQLDAQLANANPASRRTDGIKKLNEQFLELMANSAKLGKSNPLLAGVEYDGKNFSGGAYDIIRKGIESRIKDPKQPRAKAYQDDEATRMLLQLQQQESSLQGQLQVDTKLSETRKQQLRFTQLIADLQEKKVLTADQKSLLANQDAIKAQLEKNAGLDDEITKRKELQEIQSFRGGLDQTLKVDEQGYQEKLDSSGMGRLQREQLRDRLKLISNYQNQAFLLETQRGKKSQDVLDAETQALEENLEKRLKANDKYYDKLDEQQQDWAKGAKDAFSEYLDNARDMATTSKNLVSDALNGFTDGVSDSIGRAIVQGDDLRESLSNVAQTIETQLIASLVKLGIQYAINATIGQSVGVASAAISAGIAETTAAAWAPAAAMASLGSFGANSAPAIAALTSTTALAESLARGGAAGFYTGGYTGSGNPFEVAGVVHKGEYVMTADTVNRVGVNALDAVQNAGTWAVQKQTDNDSRTAGGSAGSSGSRGGDTHVTVHLSGIRDAKDLRQSSAKFARDISTAVDGARRYR